MKLATLAALLGATTAATLQQIKTDQVLLKDEMEALLELVQQVETQEQSQIFETIEVRKEVLKSLAGEMPERKRAIALEVTNLSNVVGKVLEEDYDGAVDELEARKEELMDVHNYLTSLVQAPGTVEYTMSTTNTSNGAGQSPTLGFAQLVFGDDGSVSGGVNYPGTSKVYDAAGTTPVKGMFSLDGAAIAANPDAVKYAKWTVGDNVYWVENEAANPFYYSGKIEGNTITGNYKMGSKNAFGTFKYDIYVAPPPPCDQACKDAAALKKSIADALQKTKDAAAAAAAAAKAALQGPNGVAIGLGVGGGLIAMCAAIYCCCCRKDKGEMGAEHHEGGKKPNRQSLLIHTEEA